MNTRMQFLEHELAVEEREQQRKMVSSESSSVGAGMTSASVDSSQIKQLEHRINALKAMVDGLTDEVIDLKTVCRKLSSVVDKLVAKSVSQESPRSDICRPKMHESVSSSTPMARRPIVQGMQKFNKESEGSGVSAHPSSSSAPVSSQAVPRTSSISNPVTNARPVGTSTTSSVQPSEEEMTAAMNSGQFEYIMQEDGTILKRLKTKGVENVIIAGTGFGKGKVSRSSAIRAESSAVIEAEEVKETVEL